MRTHSRLILGIAALSLATPAIADAQWRYPPIYPPYGYGYRYGTPEASLRLNVKPSDASVYVDGYYAGTVEEFDGRFQRLHVLPGEHEIVVYLEGYHSLKQRLYLSPNSSRTIDGDLAKLGPSDTPEPAPEPADIDRNAPPEDMRPPYPPARGPVTRRGPTPTDQPPPRREAGPPRGAPGRYASLSLRVQPSGATVLIDGERWDGPSNDERLIVQVTEGHHVIEIDRDGYEHFTTEVDVRRGETVPLNISMRRR